jgi:hypothetical protein
MLMRLREQEGENIPDSLTAVMIKALLVHGARQSESVKDELTGALKTARNGRQFKEVVARYMGYGTPNIPRVLECAEHRATIVGGAEIKQDQIHEYEFPLPIGLASQPLWRCLIITLAWFSPVNPKHRNLREAKLQFSPSGTKWEESDLKLKRCDGDWMQVMRGTVQHEVLEGDNLISAYQDGAVLRLKVECKKDATERLDEFIPYAIAVTLEVKEGVDIPIYQQIRAKIKPQIPLRAA